MPWIAAEWLDFKMEREEYARIEAAKRAAGKFAPYYVRRIIADPKLGLHWCVVAAMSDPRSDNRPRARGVIREWLAEQKANTEGRP